MTNARIVWQQIATVASDNADVTSDGSNSAGQKIGAGRDDRSHWPIIPTNALPSGAAWTRLRTQTGGIYPPRKGLVCKPCAPVKYRVGGATEGVARFAFDSDVLRASPTPFLRVEIAQSCVGAVRPVL